MDRDIDDLFTSLRQENLRSVSFDDEFGEDEEDYEADLAHRYEKPYEKARDVEAVQEIEEEESSKEEDDQREKLMKRLEDLRLKKQMLGPPGRIKKEEPKAKKPERPQTAKPNPAPVSRPSTAMPRTPSLILSTPSKKGHKTDRVAMYQQHQNQWKQQPFLASNPGTSRQGRKLNLSAYKHAKDFEIVKTSSVHNYIKNDYVAPHLKRRDDVRLTTRARMMSDKFEVL